MTQRFRQDLSPCQNESATSIFESANRSFGGEPPRQQLPRRVTIAGLQDNFNLLNPTDYDHQNQFGPKRERSQSAPAKSYTEDPPVPCQRGMDNFCTEKPEGQRTHNFTGLQRHQDPPPDPAEEFSTAHSICANPFPPETPKVPTNTRNVRKATTFQDNAGYQTTPCQYQQPPRNESSATRGETLAQPKQSECSCSHSRNSATIGNNEPPQASKPCCRSQQQPQPWATDYPEPARPFDRAPPHMDSTMMRTNNCDNVGRSHTLQEFRDFHPQPTPYDVPPPTFESTMFRNSDDFHDGYITLAGNTNVTYTGLEDESFQPPLSSTIDPRSRAPFQGAATTSGPKSCQSQFPPQNQIPSQMPCQTPNQMPSQMPCRTPRQTTSQMPCQTANQMPSQMPCQTPRQMPSQLPYETSNRMPGQMPSQTQNQMSSQTSRQMRSQVPCQIHQQIPTEMASQMPCQTPRQMPIQVPPLRIEEPSSSPCCDAGISTPYQTRRQQMLQLQLPQTNGQMSNQAQTSSGPFEQRSQGMSCEQHQQASLMDHFEDFYDPDPTTYRNLPQSSMSRQQNVTFGNQQPQTPMAQQGSGIPCSPNSGISRTCTSSQLPQMQQQQSVFQQQSGYDGSSAPCCAQTRNQDLTPRFMNQQSHVQSDSHSCCSGMAPQSQAVSPCSVSGYQPQMRAMSQMDSGRSQATNATTDLRSMGTTQSQSYSGHGRSASLGLGDTMLGTHMGSPESELKEHAKSTQFKKLVMDSYCPGAMQDALNGGQNFNNCAYDIVFSGILPRKPEPVDPLTMIEALQMRVDWERSEVQKAFGKRNDPTVAPADINTYFEAKHKTELNDALRSFLRADSVNQLVNNDLITGFTANVNKTETDFLGAPIKLQAYTATTSPVDEVVYKFP